MAYIDQQTKKRIADALRIYMRGKGLKYTVRIENSSKLRVTIREGRLSLHDAIIRHSCGDFDPESNAIINGMIRLIKRVGQWYDRSDSATDYFDTAFYLQINIGDIDKPYRVIV